MDFQNVLQVAVATLVMILATADAQGLFYRIPQSEDSCRSFKFTSNNEQFAKWIATLQFGQGIGCRAGQVVNSQGNCVSPTDATNDRCYTQALAASDIASKCMRNPTLRFADPTDCASYYDCAKVSPYKATCPPGQMFNDVKKSCDLFPLVYCNERPVNYSQADLDFLCQVDPKRVIPMDNCNSFYNCSSPPDSEGRFQRYGNECAYLSLFDTERKRCLPATEVQCNLRREIKYACALRQFSCGRGQHCRPCHVDFADCRGLPDGDQPYPGQEYTPYYARCTQGRSLGKGACESAPDNLPRLFDSRSLKCEHITNIPRSLGGLGDN